MEISKKVVLESNLSEIEENDISGVLTRFVALNPEKHISQSLPIIDNVLSSFEIEKYQIEFKNMSCGPKVVIKNTKEVKNELKR